MRAPAVVSSRPAPSRKRRVGLSRFGETALRIRLRKMVPSEPWLEAQIKSSFDFIDGQRVIYRYHDSSVFPPGGTRTKMVRCPRCGVFNPPNAIEHGACLDHARHDAWGPSPSALAFRRLQAMNAVIEEPELPPEDLASLKKEIEEFNNHKNCAQVM
jgi:hypothetical protein